MLEQQDMEYKAFGGAGAAVSDGVCLRSGGDDRAVESGASDVAACMGEAGCETDAGREIKGCFDELMQAFEAFKRTNDARLDDLERRGAADGVTEDKLARVNAALDTQQKALATLQARASAAPRSAVGGPDGLALAHKTAFESYIRSGEEAGLRDLGARETKALSVGSDADGGYLVPEEMERSLARGLADVSPMRAISRVQTVSASVYKRPFVVSGAGAGWVGETAARPQTGTPNLAELAFPTMELYAMPAATMQLLEDGAVDIDAWLDEEVRTAFVEQEGAAFVNGDGVNKPRGFLSAPKVDDDAWAWGALGTVETGVAGDFAATDPADVLIDLVFALKAAYRGHARFVMNRGTQAEVRKLRDGEGNYLWHPASLAGSAPTLMGYPVTEAEDMPDMAPDATAIAFGDFRRGYLIVDRRGIRVLRDRYTAKPYVLFYTTKRVGGGVQDFAAIKLLKFG